jgi:hypothetical protein
MDEPPATVRRDFKQLHVHISGNCRFMDASTRRFSIGGKCDSHPTAFDSSSDFSPAAAAAFHRARFDSRADFLRQRQRAAGVTDAGKLAR